MRHISMTIVASAAIVWGGAAIARTASSCANATGPYPSFCSIPQPPTNLKPPAVIHREVLQTRMAGRDVVSATQPSTFTLDDTTGFSGRAITEAAPPPPVTTPSEADTEAFAKAARATVNPPKHPR